MFKLIENKLKVFVDPYSIKNCFEINKIVSLVTLNHYFDSLDPCLCEVHYFYPYFIDIDQRIRKSYFVLSLKNRMTVFDEDIIVEKIDFNGFFNNVEAINNIEQRNYIKKYGEKMLSLAIASECCYFLTDIPFFLENAEKFERYHIKPVNFESLFNIIEVFCSGFFNYFKFSDQVYGQRSSDIAYIMSNDELKTILLPWYNQMANSSYENRTKELSRSLIYNRYSDLLIARDNIKFFLIQKRLFEKESKSNNVNFLGSLRYHQNYYYYLLWGATDHIARLLNGLLDLGFGAKDYRRIGLCKSKKEFKEKLELKNNAIAGFVYSDEFQDWLEIIKELRHVSAHSELYNVPQLFIQTAESKKSDEEIDEIIFSSDSEIVKYLFPGLNQDVIEKIKNIQRNEYRISKMQKMCEGFLDITIRGKRMLFLTLERIDLDMNMVKKLMLLLANEIVINIKKN